MQRFRIVKRLVSMSIYEDKPISTVVRYTIEQEHHIFGFLRWWSIPSFVGNKMFNHIEKAEQFVWQNYPNAFIV